MTADLKDPAKRAAWVYGQPMNPCPSCGGYNMKPQTPIKIELSGAKLPNVIPTDEQLTAFALGIEAAAQPLKAEQAKDAAEDAELLDWIFRQGDEFSYYVIQDAPGDGEYVVHGMGCSGQGKTPRAAIRAARAAEGKA